MISLRWDMMRSFHLILWVSMEDHSAQDQELGTAWWSSRGTESVTPRWFFWCRWLYQQRWRITRIESWGNLVTDLVIIGDDHWRHGRIFCWDGFKAALGHSSGNFRMGFSQFHGLIVMCWMLKGIDKRPMIEFQKDICAMYDRWYVWIYYTIIHMI